MSLQALYPSVANTLTTTEGETLSTSADFEVLALALSATGLTNAVAGLTDITLFAPTDAAFAGLAADFGYTGDPDDATAVFSAISDALAALDPSGDPVPLLTQILQNHLTGGASSLAALDEGGPAETLLPGADLEVTGGTVIDNDTDSVNGDIVAADIATTGGTLHVVDQVLLPFETPADITGGTLLDTLKESGGSFDENTGDFDLLVQALQDTGLDEAADDPDADLTVFAPTDAAFIALAQELGYEGEDEAGAYQAIMDASEEADPDNPLQLVTDILNYHISPGAQDAATVAEADEIETLGDERIRVRDGELVDRDPESDNAQLTQTDLTASNGTAHVIDEVLLPLELPMVDGSSTSDNPFEGTDFETSEGRSPLDGVEGNGNDGIDFSV
jgi:uncharacterized surface protein with fasciclin (FAS1) repeats